MDAIQLGCSTTVVLLAAALSSVVPVHTQTSSGGVFGRWEFTTDAQAASTDRGRGAGATAQEPAKRVVTLNLSPGAGGTVSGTVAVSGSERGGAPGGNPGRPVEIRDGKADGGRLSFSVWQFDGYRNRMHFDAIVEGDRLTLTMTRDTPSGPERTHVDASRKPY